MEPKDFFQLKKYLKVRGLFSSDLINVASKYVKQVEFLDFQNFDENFPSSHAVYGDILMESILLLLKSKMEEILDISVFPTYSYYRIYNNGDLLEPHIDRDSCEISASLCLGMNYTQRSDNWPLYFGEDAVFLETGDVVFYRGCEVEHYRPMLDVGEGSWHAQAFFHFVDKYGSKASFKFDRIPTRKIINSQDWVLG